MGSYFQKTNKATKKMKKLLLFLTLAFLTGGSNLWALDQVDGVYQIGTAQDLIDFAALVNDGSTTAQAVLTADIDMTDKPYTPIGNSTHAFCGTFDGQGHTIDHLVLNNSDYDSQGIFGRVGGSKDEDVCTIKNLIAGSNNSIKGNKWVGGLIGAAQGAGTIKLINCGNEGYVEATNENAAAILGCMFECALNIENCYNTGNIKGKKESAIISGWLAGHEYHTIKGFYNSGSITYGQDGENSLFRDGTHTYSDFTGGYERVYNTINGQQGGTQISSSQVTSGELAYFLNQYALYGGTWHQTVGSGHPVPFGSDDDVVFATLASCDGSSWTTSGFTNDKSTALIARANHTGTSDGKCALCGTWIISSPSTLTSFATAYNNGTADTYSTAYIDNNLNMSGQSFPGIGSDSKMFAGKLIGNGAKIISNLAIEINATDVGFVRVATGGAVVKNITTDCTCSFKGNSQVGAIIGTLNGGGNVYVENCGNEAPVEATNYNVGGLVGAAFSSTKGFFTNCYNVGSVKSGIAGNAAGLTFNTDGAVFTRCYSYLNSESSGMFENKWFTNTGSYTATTCYSNNSSSNTDITDLSAATMANGTLQTNLGSSYYPSTIYGANAHPGFASQVSIKLDENDVNTLPNTDMTGMNVVLYRSLTKDMWNSICLPFDLGDLGSWFGTDTKAAEFTSATSSNLHFDLVASLSANTPYLLYPKENKTSMSFNGVTVKAGGAGSVQPEGSDFKFAGIYSPTAINGKYFIATGNTIKQSSGGNLKAFRAYIEDTTSSARELSLDFGENITGIDATLLNQDVMNHEFYNLAGQRVAKPGKGLYVVNGKKVVIK